MGPMTVITMSRTEIDRMSVLRDLAANRIKVSEAATLMGLGRRQVFRLAKAYGQHGPAALVSRRRGRPSNRCYPSDLRTAVIGLIQERYPDFGPTLATEKLAELHDIHLARETVRQWMIAAGLWKDRRARLKPVHQPRYRRECLGELIQIDGSEHWWFEGRGPQCTLLVYVDDATICSLSRARAPSTILQRPEPTWSVTASRWRSTPTSTGCFGSTRRMQSAAMA
jgi:Winged helix-turn helix